MNQCDDDEKKRRKEEDYKSAFEIFLSTTIIAIIIIIIIIVNIIIIIIIIEEDEYENCVNHLEDFDTLFICFVEFFASVSSLKEEDCEEVSKFECEEDLKEEFVCVVCLFAEFSVLKNVHFDCEFCDSILILSLLSVSEFVASSIFSSTLENFASENQSSVSFSLVRKKESEIEKEIVFTSCSSVCIFINSSIENLFAFVFFVSESSFVISFEKSSAFLSSEKCEFVQEEEKEFLDEKVVIENDVSNLCETSSSNFASLDKSCVEVVEIEEKEEEKRNRFCFEFFAIDFVLNDFHVDRIKSL